MSKKSQMPHAAPNEGITQALAEDGAETRHANAAPPADGDTLVGIPYLGEARRQALADAGIKTRTHLQAATLEEIGAVHGVGLGNAKRYKEWLAVQAEMPNVSVATPLPAIDDGGASALAAANQDVQDMFQRFSSASQSLQSAIPDKSRAKALDRQLEKIDTVASELAEGPDTLTPAQVAEAVTKLNKIAALLEDMAQEKAPSAKKQDALVEELRERRKKLQKALGE